MADNPSSHEHHSHTPPNPPPPKRHRRAEPSPVPGPSRGHGQPHPRVTQSLFQQREEHLDSIGTLLDQADDYFENSGMTHANLMHVVAEQVAQIRKAAQQLDALEATIPAAYHLQMKERLSNITYKKANALQYFERVCRSSSQCFNQASTLDAWDQYYEKAKREQKQAYAQAILHLPTAPVHDIQLQKRLGSGGYGTVYEAKVSHPPARVAIKACRDTTGLTTEAEVYMGLQNCAASRTPQYYGFFILEGMGFLRMELLGTSLGRVLRDREDVLSIVELCLIAPQLITSLQDLHSMPSFVARHDNGERRNCRGRYVHRDIKPDNIVFGAAPKKDVPYLVDFGLSKEYRDLPTAEAADGERGLDSRWGGTRTYMPLAAHEKQSQQPKDDLESLGYTFCEMCLDWFQAQVNNSKSSSARPVRIKRDLENDNYLQLFKECPPVGQYFRRVQELPLGQLNPDHYEELKAIFTTQLQNYDPPYELEWLK